MSLFGRPQRESGPRSAEERERARREREARRAAREGRPVPPAPPVDDGTGDTPFTDAAPQPTASTSHDDPIASDPAPTADDSRAFETSSPGDAPRFDAVPLHEDEPRAFETSSPGDAPRFDAVPPREDAPRAFETSSPVDAPRFDAVPPREDEPRPFETSSAGDAPRFDAARPAADPFAGADPHFDAAPADPFTGAEDARVGSGRDWAPEGAEERGDVAANGGGMRKPRGATSWFDEVAAAQSPESIAPDAGQPTVEWDMESATETPAAAPDPGATQQWDVDQALGAEQEPRVTRRAPAPVRTAVPAAGAGGSPRLPRPAARYGDEDERPTPPKRIPAAARTLPPPPPPPGERRGKPGRRGRRIAAVVVLLLILGAGGWLYNALYQPFAGEGGERVRIQIPQQSTASDIGALLEAEGVVASSTFFALRSRLEGGDLKAGTYTLRRDMSYGDAIAALAAGPRAARTISLTIPEGRSRRETAPIVEDAGLRGSYLAASERSKGFQPSRYGAPRDLPSLEGFLFPATYELRPNASAKRLVAKQLDAFEDNIKQVSMRRARARNLDVYDVLIIASMVEREASLAKERPLVASVIYNRLREGMPLGIDATIRFATRNWSRPLRVSELNIDSPYNTRTRIGLPPGPIGSPGLASIKAAANPAKTDFLFYVVKPNGDGAHNFSSTDAEFQRDVDAYNRERDRRGGQDPSSSDGG